MKLVDILASFREQVSEALTDNHNAFGYIASNNPDTRIVLFDVNDRKTFAICDIVITKECRVVKNRWGVIDHNEPLPLKQGDGSSDYGGYYSIPQEVLEGKEWKPVHKGKRWISRSNVQILHK
jgi:hypothetical protein